MTQNTAALGAWGIWASRDAAALALLGFDWIGLVAQHGRYDDGLIGRALDVGEPSCAVMVETATALENCDEIAATPGFDPDEMLALTGDDSPLARIARACTTNGIVAGAYAGTPERGIHSVTTGLRRALTAKTPPRRGSSSNKWWPRPASIR